MTLIIYYYIIFTSKLYEVIKMNIQYKKGVLELLVLAQLNRQDCYGYDLSESIAGKMNISDGTVYPILRKLKEEGFLITYLSEESGGPPRKYYRLTPLGKALYAGQRAEWLQFAKTVEAGLQDNG